MSLCASFVAAVCVIAMATGCGSGGDSTSTTPTLDPAQIEPDLIDDLAQFAGVDPTTVGLDCPSGVPVEEGQEFECTLTAPDGSTAIAEVTVTSVEASGDQLDYEVRGRVPKGQFK